MTFEQVVGRHAIGVRGATRIGAVMIPQHRHVPVLVGEKLFRFVTENGRAVLAVFLRVNDVHGRRSWTDCRYERIK